MTSFRVVPFFLFRTNQKSTTFFHYGKPSILSGIALVLCCIRVKSPDSTATGSHAEKFFRLLLFAGF